MQTAATNKTTAIALVLTSVAALAMCVAATMAFTGDVYTAMGGLVVFYVGLIAGASSLPFWLWGRPSDQAGLIILIGGLGLGVLWYGGLHGLGELMEMGRGKSQSQRNERAEEEYRRSRAFYYVNVTYDAERSQLIRTGPATGEILNSAVLIPFGEAYLLILIDSSAYVFDGARSTRVEFTGKAVENGTAVTAGRLSFREKNYSIDGIGMNWAEIKAGRGKGGNQYGPNPKLIDAIAPSE
jgi:hypothetical protein